MSEAANIHEAICRIREATPYIQKDGKMSGPHGNYTYLSIDQAIASLRPHMDRFGVSMSPVQASLVSENVIDRGANRAPMQLVRYAVTYELTHAASGTSLRVATVGEGSDTLDKATNKAFTAAEKIALRQAFLLATGDDDPDHHSSEAATEPVRQGQGVPAEKLKEIVAALLNAKNEDQLERRFREAETRDLSQPQFEDIRDAANRRHEQLQVLKRQEEVPAF